MPEYLAPGVYVEETSFRAKSIEGVSTSTTGFVGPTRKGPITGTPELITNIGDFERIYGGPTNLVFEGAPTTNYVAHAVRNYFENGGQRLYVARVFQEHDGSGGLPSPEVVRPGSDDAQAEFRARFPGAAANGRIEVRQLAAPATKRALDAAPAGSVARFGAGPLAQPASLSGGSPPFALPDGGRLALTINGVAGEIVFRGQSAEVFAQTALGTPVTFDTSNNTLEITVDGRAQTIAFPTGQMSRQAILALLNQEIRGGYARLSTADDDAPTNRLVIGSDRRGTGAQAAFDADNTALGVVERAAPADVNNNVHDLGAVGAADIADRLTEEGIAVDAVANADGNLVLSTTATGDTATLQVDGSAADSVHGILGLSTDAAEGSDGNEASYHLKQANGEWSEPPDGFDALDPDEAPSGGAAILTLNVELADGDGSAKAFEDLGFDREHPRWVGHVLAERPSRQTDRLENLYALVVGDGVTGTELRAALFPAGDNRSFTFTGGNDGAQPPAAAYAGTAADEADESGLAVLERLNDISIVAAPGGSAHPTEAQAIQNTLITHAERPRAYRIAVLDTPPDQALSGAREVRGRIDSTYAALYYPWVVVSNPVFRPGDASIPREISLPPSGFVCGIYARNDVTRGVHKAPANEIVRGAIRFESDVSFRQQAVLNPSGINALRFFPGRGYRLWGARTASSDPEWKYVNVRRYFIYLEQSIDRSTQWAVFESNGPRLWTNVRETVSSFLYNEWFTGALLGASPEEAYFVRCDRSTMTQNDLDNGRLVCEIGVAVLKPAEFVIFRIGQKTIDAR